MNRHAVVAVDAGFVHGAVTGPVDAAGGGEHMRGLFGLIVIVAIAGGFEFKDAVVDEVVALVD